MPRRSPAAAPAPRTPRRKPLSAGGNAAAKRKRTRLAVAAPPLDAATIARQLLESHPATPSQPPSLLTRAALAKGLSAAAKRLLDPALEQLRAARALLVLPHGRSQLYLFAAPLAAWLATVPAAVADAATEAAATTANVRLAERYSQLVRESGGFPDVSVADLLPASGPNTEQSANLTRLHAELLRLWQTGDAVFSLGDWSLAAPAARAAAIPLAGEHYLLVRLLPASPGGSALSNS